MTKTSSNGCMISFQNSSEELNQSTDALLFVVGFGSAQLFQDRVCFLVVPRSIWPTFINGHSLEHDDYQAESFQSFLGVINLWHTLCHFKEVGNLQERCIALVFINCICHVFTSSSKDYAKDLDMCAQYWVLWQCTVHSPEESGTCVACLAHTVHSPEQSGTCDAKLPFHPSVKSEMWQITPQWISPLHHHF